MDVILKVANSNVQVVSSKKKVLTFHCPIKQ